MKTLRLSILLVSVVALSACGMPSVIAPAPTATSAPAEAPAAAPTTPPAEPAATAEEQSMPPGDTSEEENPVEEATIETSPLAALAEQNMARMAEVVLSECPPGSRTFPIPDPASNAKRPLDFTPFAEAMAGMTAEQSAALDAALAGKTLPQLQEMLDNGDVTSEQMVLYYLDRIQKYDVDRLNSVIELNPDALAIAQKLDAERTAGAAHGNLHGIPVLLKDNIAAAAPMHTTAGAYALKDWQSDRDAFLVQRLRDAGAIILGKANLSEWANYTDPCMPSGFSVIGGQTRHPYGPYDPLGSSSGSAVSVAAGLAPVSVGSETSGLLVEPARASGVVALRPSQGLISRDHIVPLEAHLDTPGPMGHSVTDVAILLTAMAGADANDAKTADAASLAGTDFTQFLASEEAQKLKVGVVQFDNLTLQSLVQKGVLSADKSQEELKTITDEQWQQFVDAISTGIGGPTQAVVDALQSQGIEVVTIKDGDIPPMIQGTEPGLLDFGFQNSVNQFLAGLGDKAPIKSLAEAVDIANEDPANRAPYGQRYVEWSANTETTPEEYATAVRDGQEFANRWMQWFKDTYGVDVILMGANYKLAGLAGIPALTIPTGRAVDQDGKPGQPTGVFITGPYLSDGQVLAVGYALEQALNVQLQPDLDATIQQIEAVTGR